MFVLQRRLRLPLLLILALVLVPHSARAGWTAAAPAGPDPAATYAQVERYLKEGAYQLAIEALARLSLAEHQSWRYHYYDGRMYLGLKQFRNAIDQFERAAAQRPSEPLIYSYWGDVYAAMKSWDQAMIQYRRAATLAAGNARYPQKLGTAAWARAQAEANEQKRRGLLAEAEWAFRIVTRSRVLDAVDRFEAWIHLGSILRAQERWSEAEQAWRQALAGRGLTRFQSGRAYLLVGLVQLDRRNWTGALGALRRAAELVPQEPAAWVGVGLAQLSLLKVPEASRSFNQALRVDPEFVRGYNGLGLVAIFSGDEREAGEHFTTMLRLAEKRYVADIRELTSTAVINRGAAEELGGDPVSAKRSYQNGLERWVKALAAHINLGNLALYEGDPGRALREYQAAEPGLSGDALFQLSLATVFLFNGHFQRALAAYDQVRQQGSKDLRPLLGAAMSHFAARRWEETASGVQRVLAAQPDNELAWFLMDALAERNAELSAALKDRLAQFHRAAAQRAGQRGQKRLSEYHWLHLLAQQPANLEAGYAIARLREGDGRLQGALTIYQSLESAGRADGEIRERIRSLEDRIRQLDELVARPPSPSVTPSPSASPSPVAGTTPTPSPAPTLRPAAVHATPSPNPTPTRREGVYQMPSVSPSASPTATQSPSASPAPTVKPTVGPTPIPREVLPPVRVRLALLPFHSAQWHLLGQVMTSLVPDGAALGMAGLAGLRAELEARGRLELADPSAVDRALQQANVLTLGWPDTAGLIRVGHACEAKMMVLVSLHEIGTRVLGRARVVEVDTSRTLRSFTAQASGSDRLGRVRQVVQHLAQQIGDQLPLEASVVTILSPQEVVINAGQEHGVQVKDNFEVWRPSAVPGREDKWADLRVIAVSPYRARALVVPYGRTSVELVIGDRSRTRL